MASEQLIDRQLLEKLELLAVRWQKSFPGLVGGHNVSRFAGPGQEFLDHRHFHHGDDLRAVNWRAYLRLEKLFLKMFQVEPRVPVRILFDVSQSMTTGGRPKLDYAKRLAAALCYVGLVRLDTINVIPFSATLGEGFVSSGGRHRLAPVVDFLTALQPKGKTSYMQVARDFVSTYPQRGLLMVISDFLDDGDCEKPLQFLSDFGHELLLLHLWAEEDRDPPWDGQLELIDAETGAKLDIAFGQDARAAYRAAFDQFARSLQELAFRTGGRYVGLSTAMTIEEAVFGPLVRSGGVQ